MCITVYKGFFLVIIFSLLEIYKWGLQRCLRYQSLISMHMHTHVHMYLGQERKGNERTFLEMFAVYSGPDPGHRKQMRWSCCAAVGHSSFDIYCCCDPVGGRLLWTGNVWCCAEDGNVASACACVVWFFVFFLSNYIWSSTKNQCV